MYGGKRGHCRHETFFELGHCEDRFPILFYGDRRRKMAGFKQYKCRVTGNASSRDMHRSAVFRFRLIFSLCLRPASENGLNTMVCVCSACARSLLKGLQCRAIVPDTRKSRHFATAGHKLPQCGCRNFNIRTLKSEVASSTSTFFRHRCGTWNMTRHACMDTMFLPKFEDKTKNTGMFHGVPSAKPFSF